MNEILELMSALTDSYDWLENAMCKVGDLIQDADNNWTEMEQAQEFINQALIATKKAQDVLEPLELDTRKHLDILEAQADALSY